MISLTFEPHDTIVTALEEQLIYNEWGWDRLRGCGVDFRAIILKETKGILTVNRTHQHWPPLAVCVLLFYKVKVSPKVQFDLLYFNRIVHSVLPPPYKEPWVYMYILKTHKTMIEVFQFIVFTEWIVLQRCLHPIPVYWLCIKTNHTIISYIIIYTL